MALTDNKYNVSPFTMSGCWTRTIEKECAWCESLENGEGLELLEKDPVEGYKRLVYHARKEVLYDREMEKIRNGYYLKKKENPLKQLLKKIGLIK